MKNSVQLAVFASVLVSMSAQAKVIYGEDNRMEVSEASPFLQKLAKSTATMVSEKKMIRDAAKPGIVQLEQKTLRDWLEAPAEEESQKLFTPKLHQSEEKGDNVALSFCDGERFTEQPNPGMCSGFLIAPDLLVTAGHCAELPTFCSEYQWVFDFQVDPATKKAGLDIKEENIYKCKRVVSNALNMGLGLDYGLVQLDRPVAGREPLEIRNNSTIENFTNLVLIGSPSGLPLKVAPGATVRENTHPFFFKTNTDSYQGNSGSAVFNAKTGVVEGILVRGEEDFVPNRLKMCVESNKCPADGCRGEDVSRLTSIPEIGVQVALNKAAETGDITNLENILKLNIWVDFYTKDGQSALMKAAQGGQLKAMEMLIAKGADINLKDVNGNTPAHFLLKSQADKALAMKLLEDKKADLTAKNNAGLSPLDSEVKIVQQ